MINDNNDHYLTISHGGGKTFIMGSIRRWYYGNDSLSDLNLDSFKDALNLIAERVNLAYSDLLHAKVIRFEFGANLKVFTPCTFILNAIVSYPRLKKSAYEHSVSFHGGSMKVKLYDKIVELFRNKNHKKTGLKKKGNYLRYEIDFRKVSALQHYLKGINTVSGIIKGWQDLFLIWIGVFEKIKFDTNFENINPKIFTTMDGSGFARFLQYQGIKNLGVDQTLKFKELISVKNKSPLKKRIFSLLEEFGVEDSKNSPKNILERAIVKKIMKIMGWKQEDIV